MCSIPILARTLAGLGIIAGVACVGGSPKPETDQAPQVFYTVTGEIALSRHEPRVAALEYAAAANDEKDVDLLRRATEVTVQSLQPSLTAGVTARWIEVDPASIEAHREAARAAPSLHKIAESAQHYRIVLSRSPGGSEAEFAALEAELTTADDVYGARQLADRLATDFPMSRAALRMQAFTTLRADDPAAAVRSFQAALATPGEAGRREMTQGLWRARILSGDVEEPLAQARALSEHEDTAENQLGYALLLVAAQQNVAARTQLELLTHDSASAAAALRLLGLIDFQESKLDDAGVRFAQLLATGKYSDDAVYYLGLIAERHEDFERALRLYAQVQSGDNAVSALLRAASVLHTHGASSAADDLLEGLILEVPSRAPEILAASARIYADGGDLPRASTVLARGAQQYPDSVELKYAMASLDEDQGKIADALHALKAIAKQRPDDPAALNAYGYTLADNDRSLRSARQYIERAYRAAPKSPAILDSMGWVLFRQGNAEQAVPYLSEAYADDRGGDIAAHLGEVLWHLGKQADAERIWSEATQADADNQLLKRTRQRLHASN